MTTYRGLHDLIGKGVPLIEIYGEMMGRAVGAAAARAAPCTSPTRSAGVMLSTGIVGAGPPVAVGLAMAAQRKGLDRVTVVSFGDGAINTGSFHEAANMAALWDLPVVLLCQNNLYGEMTPIEHTMKIEHDRRPRAGYGMPGVRVDGNDPLAVVAALDEAVQRARHGGGPTLLECVTFRFRGHYFGDPDGLHPGRADGGGGGGRPGADLPRPAARRGICSEDELEQIDNDAVAAVEDALATVLAAPPPSVDELDRDVYADPDQLPGVRGGMTWTNKR